MEKQEISKKFEEQGFIITNQAAEMITKLSDVDNKINEIINQLRVAKIVVGGGTILKYMMTGSVTRNVVNDKKEEGIVSIDKMEDI